MRCRIALLSLSAAAMLLGMACEVQATPPRHPQLRAFPSPGAGGDEFRIETRVYLGDAAHPAAENLTLFADGRVFDFLKTEPREITVFDPQQRRFTLIDPARRVETTIDGQTLLEFTSNMKVRAAKGGPLLRFQAAPEFFVQADEALDRLTLSSRIMTYHAEAIRPLDAQKVLDYRLFADWYAQLNTTRPGAAPPFARLRLNEELARRGLVPTRVRLTLTDPETNQTHSLRSEHAVGWSLTDGDRQQIDSVLSRRGFRTVPFFEYRRLDLAEHGAPRNR